MPASSHKLAAALALRLNKVVPAPWGLGWGLWLAAAFGLLGAALMVMRVNFAGIPSHFAFPLVILGYLAMGLLGGVVVGVLRPLGQHQGGATLLGMIVGIIVYAIAGIVAVGEKEFRSPAECCPHSFSEL